MISLAIILAVSLRRKKSFIQRKGLRSLQMRRMRRDVFILSNQQRNNIQRRKRKTIWVYPRLQFWFKDLAEELKKYSGDGGIVNDRWIVCYVEVLKLNHEAIVWQKNITRLFGRHLLLRATRLAAVLGQVRDEPL